MFDLARVKYYSGAMNKMEELKKSYLGKGDSEPIDVLTPYLKGAPIHVDKYTGLVYVKERRPPEEIASAWSNEVYGNKISDSSYTATSPIVKTRHVFVAEFVNSIIGLKGKKLIDLGAGEGMFLEMVRKEYGAIPFGLEPSQANCDLMTKLNIENACGTFESYEPKQNFDVASIMWTLCNVGDCYGALVKAYDSLAEGGHLFCSEGSRILVPFKKPLHLYVGPALQSDLHPWHFSANTLRTLMELVGFEIVKTNRFFDQDYLVVIGQKKSNPRRNFYVDDYKKVIEFFQRWHKDSQYYLEFQHNYAL